MKTKYYLYICNKNVNKSNGVTYTEKEVIYNTKLSKLCSNPQAINYFKGGRLVGEQSISTFPIFYVLMDYFCSKKGELKPMVFLRTRNIYNLGQNYLFE